MKGAGQTLWVERSNRPRAKGGSSDSFSSEKIPRWVDRWNLDANQDLDKWQDSGAMSVKIGGSF
jgi:hypothetical protein